MTDQDKDAGAIATDGIGDFRATAHQLVDWMADYLADPGQYPVASDQQPGDTLARLPLHAPEQSEPIERILADFHDHILPGITHWQHPRFFAYFPANNSPPSVLAEMITATLGVNCMMWETSPAASELEARVMAWLGELLGLPATFQGVIQDSASSATLCAMLAARDRTLGGDASQAGLAELDRVIYYASQEAHSSVIKAAGIIGVGRDQVRMIETDLSFAMRPDALRAAILADSAQHRRPACIIATLGTTGLGASDPLADIAAIAREFDLYLHVDAAWAGSALILPEYRHLITGIEHVDSFMFNPHKWLLTNFDFSAHWLRDPASLTRVLAISPSYLDTRDGVIDYRNWSVPLGRRFRALKLWFVLRCYGAEELRRMIARHIEWGRRFADWIEQSDEFELVAPPAFALCVFRLRALDGDTERADRALYRLFDSLQGTRQLYLTRADIGGRPAIRFCIGARTTRWTDIVDSWQLILCEARNTKRQ